MNNLRDYTCKHLIITSLVIIAIGVDVNILRLFAQSEKTVSDWNGDWTLPFGHPHHTRAYPSLPNSHPVNLSQFGEIRRSSRSVSSILTGNVLGDSKREIVISGN